MQAISSTAFTRILCVFAIRPSQGRTCGSRWCLPVSRCSLALGERRERWHSPASPCCGDLGTFWKISAVCLVVTVCLSVLSSAHLFSFTAVSLHLPFFLLLHRFSLFSLVFPSSLSPLNWLHLQTSTIWLGICCVTQRCALKWYVCFHNRCVVSILTIRLKEQKLLTAA